MGGGESKADADARRGKVQERNRQAERDRQADINRKVEQARRDEQVRQEGIAAQSRRDHELKIQQLAQERKAAGENEALKKQLAALELAASKDRERVLTAEKNRAQEETQARQRAEEKREKEENERRKREDAARDKKETEQRVKAQQEAKDLKMERDRLRMQHDEKVENANAAFLVLQKQQQEAAALVAKAAEEKSIREGKKWENMMQTNQTESKHMREMMAKQHDAAITASNKASEDMKIEMEANRAKAVQEARAFEIAMDTNNNQIRDLTRQMQAQQGQISAKDAQMQKIQQDHQKALEAYKTENAETFKSLSSTIQNLKDEAATLVVDPENPDKYNELEKANFTKFCDAAAAHLGDVPKVKKASIAVLGPSGVGKSTLINCFAGKAVTSVGITECTNDISMVFGDGDFDFYDVPGSHDARADFFKIDNLTQLKSLHMMLVVYESRIDHAAKVSKLLVSLNIPFIVVRNKFLRHASVTDEDVAEAKKVESEKLKMYTGQELPLVYVGMSTDPSNGSRMDHFEELDTMVKEMMKVVQNPNDSKRQKV